MKATQKNLGAFSYYWEVRVHSKPFKKIIPLLYYKMLYSLKAPKHLLFHLILVITVKKPGMDAISPLHTGEDLRLRDLVGHKTT